MIMQINGALSSAFSSLRLAGSEKTKTDKSDSIMLDKQGKNNGDSKVENLQSQINAIRERIQELGENTDMDEKTKAALRQSYQEQMNALEQQLSQSRMEARQEKFEAEQEQLKSNTGAERTDSSADKRKYDSYEREDPLNTAISAFNSVDIARIHQSAAKSKEGKANVLEREAEADTRLVKITGVVGHETKIRARAYTGAINEDGTSEILYEGTVNYDQLEAWDEQGIYYITAEYSSPIFGDKWIDETGEAVDAKIAEIGKLRAEAEKLTDDDAEALGDANRRVNGTENREESDETVEKAFNKAAEKK